MVLISPTAAYDAKYKMLPLTAVHEDYSDGLLNEIMEEQKEDLDEYEQVEQDRKLYDKFMRRQRLTKKELLRLRHDKTRLELDTVRRKEASELMN